MLAKSNTPSGNSSGIGRPRTGGEMIPTVIRFCLSSSCDLSHVLYT